MALAGDPIGVNLDQAGALDVDVPCAGCQYNLRGLAPEGNCPECGREISASIAAWVDARTRGFPEPAHARTLARGLDRGLAAYALELAIPLTGMLLEPGPYSTGVRSALGWSAVGAATVAWVLAVWGCWLFTAPPPVGLSPLKRSFTRVFLRCVGLLFLGSIAALAVLSWFAPPFPRYPYPRYVLPPLVIVLLASGAVTWLTLKIYAAMLANRLGHETLAIFIGTSLVMDVVLPCFATGSGSGMFALVFVVAPLLASFILLASLRHCLMRRADPGRQGRWTRWIW